MGKGHGTGKVGQGWAYGVLRMDQRVKVRIENRKVIDTKQWSWKQKWDKGGTGIGVLVQGCKECNSLTLVIDLRP